MSTLKKLASETALYGLSTIAGRLLNYMLVPIYTATFGAGHYGVLTDVYAIAAFLNVLATCGLETAYFRFSTRDREKADYYYGQAWGTVFALALTTSLVLAAIAPWLAAYLHYPGQEVYFYILAGIIFTDAIISLPFARLRLSQRPIKFVSIRLGSIVMNVALNLLLLYGLPYVGIKLSSEELLIGVFVANLLANALMVPALASELRAATLRLNLNAVKPMLNYGYPILLMGLAGMVNEMLGRLMLKKLLPESLYPHLTNQEALGVFGACYKLSVFMTITIQAFRYAAEPFFFNRAGQKDSPQTFARVMLGFTWFCALIMAGVCLNLDWIAPLFLRRPVYLEGLGIVPLLLLANLLLGIYYNLSVWFKLTDRTHYGTYISLGGAALTVFGNYLLIPVWGYTGSAMATLVCYGLMAVACYLLGQKYYPVPYPVAQIVLVLGLGIGLSYFGLAWKPDQVWLSLLVKNGAAVAMAAAGFLALRKYVRPAA